MENQPSDTASPQGRRVLVAVVTGEAGSRIQAWRERYDPAQAARLPPHVTLCYQAGGLDGHGLERQVRYAFSEPVIVTLGGVREFDNSEETFYVEVLETAALDGARRRLHDGAHCALPSPREWTWHVTCVRDSRGREKDELRRVAAELWIDAPWTVDTVAWLELRGSRYEPVATWSVRDQGAAGAAIAHVAPGT